MGRRVVAIHQPNFLPWLGYFQKIAYSDVFVALDTVQFAKTGGTWSNRVRVLINGSPAWLTMPVDRAFHGVRLLSEMRMAATRWRDRMLRTLRLAYARAPHFGSVFPVVEEILVHPAEVVGDFNLAAIRRLTSGLGIDPAKIVAASTLAATGRATDLLVTLVKQVGGTAYLCGGGAGGYQEDEKFAAAGLELIYQHFRHPVYPQHGTSGFVPGLSIVDALMSCGFDGTRQLIRETEGPRHLGGSTIPAPDRAAGTPPGGR